MAQRQIALLHHDHWIEKAVATSQVALGPPPPGLSVAKVAVKEHRHVPFYAQVAMRTTAAARNQHLCRAALDTLVASGRWVTGPAAPTHAVMALASVPCGALEPSWINAMPRQGLQKWKIVLPTSATFGTWALGPAVQRNVVMVPSNALCSVKIPATVGTPPLQPSRHALRPRLVVGALVAGQTAAMDVV